VTVLATLNGHKPSAAQAEAAVALVLTHLGYDPTSPGLVDTPGRVVRALRELTAGHAQDPAAILSRQFPSDERCDNDEIIALSGITFEAVCEHHMMPFTGTVTVAYIPVIGAPVVGLSKLARLVDVYARRLTMQERLTRQITTALDAHLSTRGSACIVCSHHTCMGLRGVRKPGAEMVTSSLTGLFRDDPRSRDELLSLVRVR
jgi:GTP cyclohydrolase IA